MPRCVSTRTASDDAAARATPRRAPLARRRPDAPSQRRPGRGRAAEQRPQLLAAARAELHDRRAAASAASRIVARRAPQQARLGPRDRGTTAAGRWPRTAPTRARRRDSATAAAAASASGSDRTSAANCGRGTASRRAAAWTRSDAAHPAVLHAAERRVDVRIARPEPVAEVGRSSSRAVAGDAPFITKCSPSKKSAEYSG